MSEVTQIGRHGLEAAIVKGITLVLVLLLLAPIVMVIVMSFTAATTLQFPPPGLSLRWYEEVWALLTGPDAAIARFGESLVGQPADRRRTVDRLCRWPACRPPTRWCGCIFAVAA